MAVGYQYCTGRVDVFIAQASFVVLSQNAVANNNNSKQDAVFQFVNSFLSDPTAYINQQITYNAPTSTIWSYLPVYVGTCEQYPIVQGGQNWNPWFADQTGCMEPADWEYQGEYKIISMDFNKFIQSNLGKIHNLGFTTPFAPIGIGQLLQGNNSYLSLWLRFANFGNPTVPPDLPPGEFYPCCRLVSSGYGPIGTRNRTTQVVMRTTPLLNIAKNMTLTYSTSPGWFTNLPDPDNPNN